MSDEFDDGLRCAHGEPSCDYCLEAHSRQVRQLETRVNVLEKALERIEQGNPASPGRWLTDVQMAEIARVALAEQVDGL